MVFSYEDRNDDTFYGLYRISWLVVTALGIVGVAYLVMNSGISIDVAFLQVLINNFSSIMLILSALVGAALVVGWIQVALASKLGEELVLLVTWVTPFAVIGVSLFLFNANNDINYLGGTVAGLLFLGFVFYFRKSLRLSARLIEVGAEVTTHHPSLFLPQLTSVVATTVLTILMVPGVIVVAIFSLPIHPILTWFLEVIYMFLYTFAIAAFQAFADASNISFVDYWYSKSGKPGLSKAAGHVKSRRAPIVRFAFLTAFISRFRRDNGGGFTPFRLFELMKFSNWKKVLFRGRSILGTAARTAQYFGSYTLVVLMVKNMNSVAQAYKESAKTVFERFVENIAGSMGFNILESFRQVFSALLMLIAGGAYGYLSYGQDIVMAIVFAFLFLFLGYYPLNAMFKPAINAYRVILYRAHTGKISSKLDSKTKEIIKAVI